MYFILYYIYTTLQPKNSLFVGIFEEIDSFIGQKYTSWKCDKKTGQVSPPPLIWTKSKRAAVFFRENVPKFGWGCILLLGLDDLREYSFDV